MNLLILFKSKYINFLYYTFKSYVNIMYKDLFVWRERYDYRFTI